MTLFDAGPPTPVPGWSAMFSPDGVYRYRLGRDLPTGDPARRCVFVMLNPSRATDYRSDNTITRCIGFAQREGCGRLDVVNLFAFVSPYPKDLLDVDDPVGPANNLHIVDVAVGAEVVIGGWGANKLAVPRSIEVRELLDAAGVGRLWCFGVNANGSPVHPLYQPTDQPLTPWEPRT